MAGKRRSPKHPDDVRRVQTVQPRKRRHQGLQTREVPLRLLNWKLDWKLYFRKFCEKHGGKHGNGVEIDGRLIFEDGWGYSAVDYRGPEFRPPTGPALKALMTRYWTERLGIVKDEIKFLSVARENLRDSMLKTNMPLMRELRRDERKQFRSMMKQRIDIREVSLDKIDERLRWLEADAAECERKIKELTDDPLLPARQQGLPQGPGRRPDVRG